jgi:hypothetical protein
MKKKTVASKKPALAPVNAGARVLFAEVRELIQSARHAAASVNTLQVLTNFEIGRRIVEQEQKGAKRAEYGAELLKELSARLTEEFGKGFSVVNLANMRRFFLTWKSRGEIFQTASEKSASEAAPRTVGQASCLPSVKMTCSNHVLSFKDSSAVSQPNLVPESLVSQNNPVTLSWIHYVCLLGIKNPEERSFYVIEARQAGWNVRELQRQKASCLYERLALSRNRKTVRQLATEGQRVTQPEDLLKEPYVLDKKDAIVKLTLPTGANIHAKEYQLYLPSKELLRQKLLEWTRNTEKSA